MHIAFIGGTRFIGHAAASAALFRGHEVSVLHRGRHRCELTGAREVLVDRQDPSVLCERIARLAPDAVVDTRAMTRADAEVTVLALRVTPVPAVVLSSQDVYAQFGRLNGLPAPEPEPIVTEASPLTIPFPFRELGGHEAGPDYDKKEVESVLHAAVEAGLPGVTVLRLPAVYGRRDPRRRFGSLVDRLALVAPESRIPASEPPRGSMPRRELPCREGASFRLTHAHVRDVAHAIVLAAERRASGYHVLNVGESETPTMRQRAEGIARVMGVELVWCETESLPDELALLGPQPNDFVASSDAIRAKLGFSEVTSERERYEDIVAWAAGAHWKV